VLARDGYLDHENEPYCNACYSRLFKPKGYGVGTSLELDYGPGRRSDAVATSARPENNPPPPPMNKQTAIEVKPTTRNLTFESDKDSKSASSSTSIASPEPVAAAPPIRPSPPPSSNTNQAVACKPSAAVASTAVVVDEKQRKAAAGSDANAAPKCTICRKTVYKMEEMVAVGHVWHKSCFTCGARADDGCKRVLNRQNYVDHENCPYCTACHNKLFRPKGFGYSNALMLDYGPTTAVGTSSAASVTNNTMAGDNMNRKMKGVGVNADDDSNLRLGALVIDPPGRIKPTGVSNDFPAAHLTGPIPTSAPTLEIGRSSATRGSLHKEASYVGNNDEVGEDEWN